MGIVVHERDSMPRYTRAREVENDKVRVLFESVLHLESIARVTRTIILWISIRKCATPRRRNIRGRRCVLVGLEVVRPLFHLSNLVDADVV